MMKVSIPSWGQIFSARNSFKKPADGTRPACSANTSQSTNGASADTAIARTFSAGSCRPAASYPQSMYASQRLAVAGTPSFPVLPAGTDPTHVARQKIAHDTLTAMAEALYIVHDVHYDLTQRIKSMVVGVRVYGADATLEPPAWGKGS